LLRAAAYAIVVAQWLVGDIYQLQEQPEARVDLLAGRKIELQVLIVNTVVGRRFAHFVNKRSGVCQ